jgi:hypothetical protein
MCRYVLYLAVALLAFGIGLFIVFKFWKKPLKIVEKETLTEIKPIEQNNTDKNSKIEFGCEDEAARTVWEKLKNDKKFMDETYAAIEARHINDCQELFETQKSDLNDDNSDEVIFRGIYGLFCGSSGDCPTWIVSKINNEYRIIFEAWAGDAPDGLQFLQKKTHNLKDIKVKLDNGWAADNFGIFKFDGKQYRIKQCFKDVNSYPEYKYYDIYIEKLIPVKLDECLKL